MLAQVGNPEGADAMSREAVMRGDTGALHKLDLALRALKGEDHRERRCPARWQGSRAAVWF